MGILIYTKKFRGKICFSKSYIFYAHGLDKFKNQYGKFKKKTSTVFSNLK